MSRSAPTGSCAFPTPSPPGPRHSPSPRPSPSTRVNLSQVATGDRVLVTGAGPVGLLTVSVLLARGVTDITVSEPSAPRRARATAVGATAVMAPDEFPTPRLGRPVDEPFDVVFECSGHGAAAESALDQLDFAGTLVFVGTGRELPRINHNRMIVLELSILGRLQLRGRGVSSRPRASGRWRHAHGPAHRARRHTLERRGRCHGAPGAWRDRGQGPGATGAAVMTESEFRPRLNHVAISVDPSILDEEGRATVLDFYGQVFGWTEGDNSGEVGNPLILYTGAPAQFVYLLPAEPFLVAPALDHFGLQLGSVAELEQLVQRARTYQRRDERVRIIDTSNRLTHGPTHDYVLTSAYIGFLLPLMIELQHLERRQRRAGS